MTCGFVAKERHSNAETSISPRTNVEALDVGVPLLSWRERQIMR
jgi:hypothetical protein